MGIGISIQVLDTDPVFAYCYSCGKNYDHLLVNGRLPFGNKVTCECGCDYIAMGYVSPEFNALELGICYSTWSDIIDYIGNDFQRAVFSALGEDDQPHYSFVAAKPEAMLECISRVPGINGMIKQYHSGTLDRIEHYVVALHFMCNEAMRMGRVITGG